MTDIWSSQVVIEALGVIVDENFLLNFTFIFPFDELFLQLV